MRRNRLVVTALGGKAKTYAEKIIATAPILYLPLNETSGTAAVNYGTLGTGANGTYSGVTLAQTAAPGGGLAPSFDGNNDKVEIYSDALRDAFNGALGSVALWCKVSEAGVWTDSAYRYVYNIGADANNRVYSYKNNSNNQLIQSYTAGGTVETRTHAISPTAWFHLVCTWSKAADQVIYYVDGSPIETDTSLGNYAGTLATAVTDLGSNDSFFWKGYLAHFGIWAAVLSPTQITALYNGGL